MKRNKYTYLYVLQGDYGFGHGWEDLCAEDKALPHAFKRIRGEYQTYRVNEGGRYRIIERRELNNTQEGA